MENLNLLYNKTYYDGISSNTTEKINIPDVDEKNNRLTESAVFNKSADYVSCAFACHTFRLYTIYPGLLVGTGYAHGVKNDEDIKIGFLFDYVTGLPYIPGSTVKGVLRSIFKHKDVIAEILSKKLSDCITLPDEIKDKVIAGFENNIFEDDDEVVKDVFLDAVIFQGGRGGKILGFDNITPHDNAVKNPKPIKILKILPDVGFEFRFVLKNSEVKVGDTKVLLTADTKLNLFKELLLVFGIGAKTNVGYGNLREVTAEDNDASRQAVTHPEVSIPKTAQDGICKNCGKETKQKKDGTYWEYCSTCKNIIDAKKKKESRAFSLLDNSQNKNKRNKKNR